MVAAAARRNQARGTGCRAGEIVYRVVQEDLRMIVRTLTVTLLVLAVALPVQADTVHKREKRQEKRIEHGERTGNLSEKEADRLQNKEGALKQEEQAMRNANGGHLSASDRNALRHQENKDSGAIRRQKHDGNNN
jgi:hypothetical protein